MQRAVGRAARPHGLKVRAVSEYDGDSRLDQRSSEVGSVARQHAVLVVQDHDGAAGRPRRFEEIDRVAGADWVQIGMLPRAAELRSTLRKIRPKVRIGQDCSVSDGYEDLSVAFESTDLAHAHTVATTALRRGAELAVVTLGPDGAMSFGHGGLELQQRAKLVEPVDTTGAGDSFIAGFIAGYLRSLDLAAAMSTGAAWAARTCSHVGGFPQDADAK